MQVLLLQDIKGLGRRMEVKNVSDGYARNFLIPRQLALPADKAALAMKSQADAQEQALLVKLQGEAARLEKESLEFKVKTGDRGEVFGSVTKEMIKKTLQEKGFADCEVSLPQSLKTLGEHQVEAIFKRGMKGKVRAILTPER